jgi:heme exporter protein A
VAGTIKLSGTDLTCWRGGREVFRGVSFQVASGESLLLTGRNGAGKSSLLRMIAGLLRIAGGRLAVTGGPADREIAEQAHYLGHLDAFKPSLTVLENLSFWISYLEGAGTPRPALEAVGLGSLADLPAGYLSAGQKRRLSLARLVAIKRPLWLLDEPTSALDAAAQTMLLDLMRQHLASGGLIVAATHQSLDLQNAHELRLGAPA